MKSFRLILCVPILLTCHFAFSQSAPENNTTPASHAVYAEFGGPGLVISANFDMRLSRQKDGLGIRAGIGTNVSGDPSFVTIPVELNYLMGHGGNYFEVGAGATYASLSNETSTTGYSIGGKDFHGNHQLVFATTLLGYRRQPSHGGFNFRAGITPFFGEGVGAVLPYLSLGYNF